MEDPGGSAAEGGTPSQAGAPKSKLDTLSKDDLIKYAKKQIAAMQKMKSKCADLEKEVESLRQQPKTPEKSSEDALLIQELTERMDVLLLEKAETQQSLALSRKELERTKQQAKEDLAALQSEHERVVGDHLSKISTLESSIEESRHNHREEVAHFQKLLQEREERDRERESEREKERKAELASAEESAEEVRRSLEAQLETLRAEIKAIQDRSCEEAAELEEKYQRELTKAQQDVENLREDLAQKTLQHEEEMRALEEDCEMERDRLVLLTEELTEQLALKDSHLQDVQEEDEDPSRGSGIARMLELSGCQQAEPQSDGGERELSRLRTTLDDLQAQNTMLRDELTLLGNVKGELEAELERVKEEFHVEKEELEFKINELQMIKDSPAADPVAKRDPEQQGVQAEVKDALGMSADDQKTPNPNEELRTQCEALTRERNAAVAECQHMRDILQSVETELGEKTNDFVRQYNAMKETAANTVQDLQEEIEQLNRQREATLARMTEVTEERNTLRDNMEDLRRKLDRALAGNQSQCTPTEEQTALKQSVTELTVQNAEIFSQLKMKENAIQDLEEMVAMLSEERDKTQRLLKLQEDQLQSLSAEKAREIQVLLEEKERETLLLRDDKNKETESLRTQLDNEARHLKEEREKMEESLKEKTLLYEEAVSSSELRIKELAAEKDDLHRKQELALSELSTLREDRTLLASKLADLEAQMEQRGAEKQQLEEKFKSLTEEADKTSASVRLLEETQSEALQKTTEELQELRTCVDELQKERNLLKRRLEEAEAEKRDEDVRADLQAHVGDLEKERDMLRANLEEVVRDVEGLQRDLQDMKSVNEKISEENQKLQAQISLAQEEEEERETKTEKTLREQLVEKDALVSQLRTEISALQESNAQSAASQEDGANDTSKKLALLEDKIKEKDERLNKIKAVAVKAKKELDNSKKEVAALKEEVASLKAEREKINTSMKDIIHGAEGYKNLQIDYDRQTEQLDKEREKVEAAERQIAELTKRLSSAVTQKDALSSEKEDLLAGLETLRSTAKQLETKNQDLQKRLASLDRELLAERAMKEQKLKDLSSATKEVEELTAQLHKQQQQSQQTAQELDQLRKEAQQSSLMDMEMADYERLVKELNGKLTEKDECMEELKGQINALTQTQETHKQEIEALKSQLDQEEEKTMKMKQLLVKTKKDLADAKKQESSLMMQQASLKGELEANQQQLETSKIEMCELTGERHRLQEQLKSALEQQQRTSSSLQQRVHSLQQERDAAKAELVATTSEFESYKVRVHNVLRQQKSKTSAQAEGDSGKLEREQLSSQVEQLRSKLSESQQSLHSSLAELQQLQTEHDTLLERHNKILQENVAKEAELRERVLTLQTENVSLRSDLSQAQADLSSQVESQRQTYREQLKKLQDDHRSTVETLQGQLSRVEEQLFNLQSQNSAVSALSSRKTLASELQRRNADQSQAGTMGFNELQSMAREEGEGMETTETERSSPKLSPLPSLEQLLTSPDPKQEPFVWTVEPTKEELVDKLSTATRSMEHMNGLLHETEATNAVLMEQITLLKSEVRRLERNQEREKSVANLEYLKNVLLQFIFLRSGSERQALLPVIHTMLQLSPEEKSKLAAIAQGEEEGSGSRGSGWSSYLHSWSGIR
uniref:GRIP and coiled-coil domain containing 2 n=1 Tax=Fundulus heteroclitus TaxID=8078 RepID=A0A3Q2P7T0_FUNHE